VKGRCPLNTGEERHHIDWLKSTTRFFTAAVRISLSAWNTLKLHAQLSIDFFTNTFIVSCCQTANPGTLRPCRLHRTPCCRYR